MTATGFIGVIGFAVLVWMTAKAYGDAPPIPDKVLGPDRRALFTGKDILAGQQVLLNDRPLQEPVRV